MVILFAVKSVSEVVVSLLLMEDVEDGLDGFFVVADVVV